MPLSPEEISARLEKFDSILIPHPRLARISEEIAHLSVETRARIAQNERRQERAGRRPIKLDELWILPVIGPSGSGKSFSIKTIVDQSYETCKEGEIPILPVTLRASTKSPRQLQHQILEAFNDPSASVLLRERDYSESTVNDAIRKIARKCNTTIIILDEAHNLLAQGGARTPNVMAKAFRSLVNDGIFSVVVAGTSEMAPLLKADAELLSRQREAVMFDRLGLDQEDCRYFLNFVARFENDLVREGIIDRPIGLTASADSCATVYDLADGVIGIVVRVLRLAFLRGVRKEMPSVDWADVAHAFRNWASAQEVEAKKRRFDPFETGPRRATETAMDNLVGAMAA